MTSKATCPFTHVCVKYPMPPAPLVTAIHTSARITSADTGAARVPVHAVLFAAAASIHWKVGPSAYSESTRWTAATAGRYEPSQRVQYG